METRRPALALNAMQHCLARALPRGAPARRAPGFAPDGIEHVPLAGIAGIADYSRFMLRELGAHFSGAMRWSCNGTASSPTPRAGIRASFDSDYIGAPWPGQAPAVGNGGFSLRSRRLVDAPGRHRNAGRAPRGPAHLPPVPAAARARVRHPLRAGGAGRTLFVEAREPATATFGCHGFFNHRMLDEDALLAYLDLCRRRDRVFGARAAPAEERSIATAAPPPSRLHALRMRAGRCGCALDALKLRGFARAGCVGGID
ncbi:MAG: hypothetical protein U1F20_04800 [Lysobacterales bacterium]